MPWAHEALDTLTASCTGDSLSSCASKVTRRGEGRPSSPPRGRGGGNRLSQAGGPRSPCPQPRRLDAGSGKGNEALRGQLWGHLCAPGPVPGSSAACGGAERPSWGTGPDRGEAGAVQELKSGLSCGALGVGRTARASCPLRPSSQCRGHCDHRPFCSLGPGLRGPGPSLDEGPMATDSPRLWQPISGPCLPSSAGSASVASPQRCRGGLVQPQGWGEVTVTRGSHFLLKLLMGHEPRTGKRLCFAWSGASSLGIARTDNAPGSTPRAQQEPRWTAHCRSGRGGSPRSLPGPVTATPLLQPDPASPGGQWLPGPCPGPGPSSALGTGGGQTLLTGRGGGSAGHILLWPSHPRFPSVPFPHA